MQTKTKLCTCELLWETKVWMQPLTTGKYSCTSKFIQDLTSGQIFSDKTLSSISPIITIIKSQEQFIFIYHIEFLFTALFSFMKDTWMGVFPFSLKNIVLWEEYLVVLVGCHSDEGSLREDMGAESRVLGAKAIILICLDNMETRLVFVHGVQNYLHGGRVWEGEIDRPVKFPEPHTDAGSQTRPEAPIYVELPRFHR